MEKCINENGINIAEQLLSIITNYQNGELDQADMNKNLLINLFSLSHSTPNFLNHSKYRDYYLPISRVSYDVETNLFFNKKNCN